MADRQRYADRAEAGRVLAAELGAYADRADVLVVALPRGGVPVAAQVAAELKAPLDVVVVRKLGLPTQPELAMGAVAGVGDTTEVVRNEAVITQARLSSRDFEVVREREVAQLRRKRSEYRGQRAAAPVTGRIVIVVDDGLATGSTMRAALTVLARLRPAATVVAAPVGSPTACAELQAEASEVVCPWRPRHFVAVGQAYREFDPVADDDVAQLLSKY